MTPLCGITEGLDSHDWLLPGVVSPELRKRHETSRPAKSSDAITTLCSSLDAMIPLIHIKADRLRKPHTGIVMETSTHDLIELARICREQARGARSRQVAAELRRMAKEYQQRAAQLDAV